MSKNKVIKGRWHNINKKIKKRLVARYHKIKDWKMDPKGYFLIKVDKKKKIYPSRLLSIYKNRKFSY